MTLYGWDVASRSARRPLSIVLVKPSSRFTNTFGPAMADVDDILGGNLKPAPNTGFASSLGGKATLTLVLSALAVGGYFFAQRWIADWRQRSYNLCVFHPVTYEAPLILSIGTSAEVTAFRTTTRVRSK